jgi:hypothetical protein
MPSGFAKFAPILNGPSTNLQLFAAPALNPVFCRFQSGVFCVLIAREWFKAILDGMQLAREPFTLRPANRSNAFPFSGLVIVDGRTDDCMVVIN